MATLERRVDRHVQRTRQRLKQAFLDEVREKGFAATSVRVITERADVNRGTFYLHYADKYQLLDVVMRAQFHEQLANAVPPEPRWDRRTLEALIRAVLECLERKYRHQTHPSRLLAEIGPLLECAMHEELTSLLVAGLRQAGHRPIRGLAPPETVASIVGWTILGTALQWSRAPLTVPADEMARVIMLVIAEGIAGTVPE